MLRLHRRKVLWMSSYVTVSQSNAAIVVRERLCLTFYLINDAHISAEAVQYAPERRHLEEVDWFLIERVQ